MYNTILILLVMLTSLQCSGQELNGNTITKNNMTVSWRFHEDRIHFEMSAPTTGWVTIGFNTHSGTKGAYLLMGNIVEGKPAVVEHYTLSPGNYQPIESLGESPQVSDIAGVERANSSTLKFSLPVKSANQYQRELAKGLNYTMIIAYSQEDDFQHHSMMRTSVDITL